jgi:NADH-quinone oxidoreductase subunit J
MNVLAAAADTSVQLGGGEAAVFWILGPVALAGALGMVLSRNAIHSALWLVLTMLSLGVFYVVQSAPFLGAVQIIVYTGAIMILFLFVLMLVGRDSSDSVVETLRGQRVAAILLGIGFAGLVGAGIARATEGRVSPTLDEADSTNNIPAIAELLFTRYLLAFEVTSALLITAAVGAMVLAHIEREPGTRRTQKDLSKARFLEGTRPQTLPGPGVFARGNSVAAPALLPDGRLAEDSFATGIEPQEIDELPRPAGRRQLGSPDDALGTLDPAPFDGRGDGSR